MQKILIIGNGIAGSALAWTLMQRGLQVSVADGSYPDAASQVAAGIINPITGRRYVKTWMLDELYPFAKNFYKKIEETAGLRLWYDCPILRLLSSTKEYNDWCARAGDLGYAEWMSTPPKNHEWLPFIKKGFEFGALTGSARIDFSAFNQLIISRLEKENRFLKKRIGYNAIPRLKKDYDRIIFCEGYRAFKNPFFSGLPWQVAKGEVLIIELENPPEKTMEFALKKEVMVVPVGANRFWVGANYEWFFDDSLPSQTGRDFLLEKLAEMLSAPYKIIEHKAAIRPTARNYRPFLGQHPEDPQLVIFNALGTKGALLAPYWAQHLVDHLFEGKALSSEVDWIRYRKDCQE